MYSKPINSGVEIQRIEYNAPIRLRKFSRSLPICHQLLYCRHPVPRPSSMQFMVSIILPVYDENDISVAAKLLTYSVLSFTSTWHMLILDCRGGVTFFYLEYMQYYCGLLWCLFTALDCRTKLQYFLLYTSSAKCGS